jgi:hypothetical protein
MSEEFSEDFEIEEEEEESSSRSFLIIAGSLIGVFILIAACTLAYIVLQRGQTQDEIASIESANATTEAQNALVTQTVQAMETEAARPTEEPIALPPEAATEEPAQLPEAVDTPEVEQPAVEQTAAAVVEQTTAAEAAQTASAEAEAEGTSVVGTDGGQATATPLPGGSGSTPSESGPETLPETGLSIWGILGLGLGLIAILLIARRLRTG